MNAILLTPELYNELKQANFKYLICKRNRSNPKQEVYEPVKELPNCFVIKLNSIEDEAILASIGKQQILIDY